MVEILMIIGMVLMLVWMVVGIMTIVLMVTQVKMMKIYKPMNESFMRFWDEEEEA